MISTIKSLDKSPRSEHTRHLICSPKSLCKLFKDATGEARCICCILSQENICLTTYRAETHHPQRKLELSWIISMAALHLTSQRRNMSSLGKYIEMFCHSWHATHSTCSKLTSQFTSDKNNSLTYDQAAGSRVTLQCSSCVKF